MTFLINSPVITLLVYHWGDIYPQSQGYIKTVRVSQCLGVEPSLGAHDQSL
jgi:hypothetical protein